MDKEPESQIPRPSPPPPSPPPAPSPPPVSPPPPPYQPPAAPHSYERRSGMDTYQEVAEKVGFIPDIDWRRNLLQLAIITPFVLIGFIIGLFADGLQLGFGLAFGGLVVGVIVSGVVLMVTGWTNQR